MEVSPQAREFGEIKELTPEQEAHFAKLVEEGKIVARGPKEELLKLQDDLRKLSYKQIK